MDRSLKVELITSINAPAGKVWDALTNPTTIHSYFFGTEVICEWTQGKPIIFQGNFEGHKYRDHGTILEIIPEKTLRYDYWSGFSGLEDHPENYSLVTYQLKPLERGTELSLLQEGFANERSHEHAQISWKGVMQKLKEIVEAN